MKPETMTTSLPIDVGFDETARFVGDCLPKKGMRILDAGCGRGGLAARLIASGHEVVGIDRSEEAAELAKHYGVKIRIIDFQDFSDTELFDVVIFSRSVHHVHPLMDAMKRAHSLLRPGGKLILEEFGVDQMDGKTAQWFYDLEETLSSLGVLSKADEDNAPSNEGYLNRWKAEHHHEPALNTSTEILAAAMEISKAVHQSKAPYLYRYFLNRLLENASGHTLAKRLLDLETRLINQKRVQPIGFRYVGVKETQ